MKTLLYSILALIIAAALVGCGKGFAKGDLTASPTISTDSPSPESKQPYGEWFCPDSLIGLVLAESGECTLYKMTSPTSQKEESQGSYTINGGKLTLSLSSETLEYDLMFNGNKMLVLTAADGSKYTFTPAS